MTNPRETCCAVATLELLNKLARMPLPFGLGESPAEQVSLRDVYLDTPDGQLRARGIVCRFRTGVKNRQRLSVFITPGVDETDGVRERFEADVEDVDAMSAIAGTSKPARHVQAAVDLSTLTVAYTVNTERLTRRTSRGWLLGGRFDFTYDAVTVERNGIVRPIQELRVRRLRNGSPSLASIATSFVTEYGLRPILTSRIEREWQVASAIDREASRRRVGTGHAVMLITLDRGTIACRSENGSLQLPSATGSGIAACQHLLRTTFGSSVGELRLLGELPGSEGRPHLEIWLALHVRQSHLPANANDLRWLSLDDLISRAGTPSLSDPLTLAALLAAARSDLASLTRVSTPSGGVIAAQPEVAPKPSEVEEESFGDGNRLLDGERSLLEFNARVLAIAEDPRTPLLERLQYLSIVSANTDEFFAVRMAALHRLRADISGERRTASAEHRTSALAETVRRMAARQSACYRECIRDLSSHGIRLLTWDQLAPEAVARLREYFKKVVFPALTPQAVTEAPGYPRPQVASFALSFAVMVKDPQTGPLHLTYVRVPAALPRMVRVSDNSYLLLEELIRDRLDALYPGRAVLQAFAFRVTRSGELEGEDDASVDLLQVIEEDTKRRMSNAVVRVEVERAMPPSMRTALLGELRFDSGEELLSLGPDDVYEVDGPIDLTALKELASLQVPALRFPPVLARVPFHPDRSVFSIIRERDRIVHHPYDDFSASVQRFIQDAADDPDVTTIKLTLYRAGERSLIIDAAARAAASGKDVTAFVELKARFDEERNIRWAQQLRNAGVHVVHGITGLKTHAKLALVVRREFDTLRSYVHIGTGNYNAGTARVYTDLGLFTADESLAGDVRDLFNELTGSSEHPRGEYRRLLVAPHAMLPGLLTRIDREAEHARAGRPTGIRLKLNGLSDAELIDALYRASIAGVDVDVIVRGVCRLRPGVPGLSERIRVRSILGRFLEHARIYRFTNGGDPEYFIGSADWRPRNVRRRVETAAPIIDPSCRATLDAIFDREMADPTAWELLPDASYRRSSAPADPDAVAQNVFAAEALLQAPADLAPA